MSRRPFGRRFSAGADGALGTKGLNLARVVTKLLQDLFRLSAQFLRRQPDLRLLSVIANGMTDERDRRARGPLDGLEAPVVRDLRIGHDIGIVVDRRVPDATRFKYFDTLGRGQLCDVSHNRRGRLVAPLEGV